MHQGLKERILIFSKYIPPVYSGAGLQALKHADILNKNGLKAEILTIRAKNHKKDANIDELNNLKISEIYSKNTSSRLDEIILSFLISKWIFKHRRDYDLFVFFGVNLNVYLPILLIKILLNKKIVLRSTLVGTDDLKSIQNEKMGKIKIRIILMADYYMAISKYIYDLTEKELIRFNTKMRAILIHNPVDYKYYSPAGSEENKIRLREKYNLSQEDFVAISIGFFSKRKQIHKIIESFKHLSLSRKNSRLILVCKSSSGSFDQDNTDYIDYCHHLVRENKLTKSINFYEEGDVREMLRISDLFIFASLQEGCPNAVLEAKSVGLPVYIFQRDWITSDIIDNNFDGFILSKDDPKEMAKLITRTISDHKSISNNAISQIINHYDNGQVLDGYLKILKDDLQSINH